MEHPDGYLTTCPSTSPEARFTLENGVTFSVGDDSTHDFQILADLVDCTAEAANILGIDHDFIAQIKEARTNFPNIFPLDEDDTIQPWQFKTIRFTRARRLYGFNRLGKQSADRRVRHTRL